ncbi:MAG: enoyl-CoA hydratase/isomerase family protein [Acidimicrobiales bacterium]
MTDDQTDDAVRYHVQGPVATVAMQRPALNVAVKERLREAVSTAAGDPDVRVMVLTGAGRVFCAGQDLGEHAEALRRGPDAAFATLPAHYDPIITALTGAPKPVVAAINGTCAGGGLSLALACDVRVAVAGSKFTTAFAGIGLTFDSGMSATLSRAAGTARASELVMLGEVFTAEQALEWGLVGRVVPAEGFEDAVASVVSRLAGGPTRAFAAAKRAIQEAWAAPLDEVLAAEARAQIELGATRDHRGAVEDFLAKRKPTFTGRD